MEKKGAGTQFQQVPRGKKKPWVNVNMLEIQVHLLQHPVSHRGQLDAPEISHKRQGSSPPPLLVPPGYFTQVMVVINIVQQCFTIERLVS